VTSGRDPLGVIELVDGAFIAIDVDGIEIGRFDSLKQAARAFNDGRAR
jgi:hypothetical protein